MLQWKVKGKPKPQASKTVLAVFSNDDDEEDNVVDVDSSIKGATTVNKKEDGSSSRSKVSKRMSEWTDEQKEAESKKLRTQGNMHADAGRMELALGCFSRAAELHPTAELHEMCSQILLELGSIFAAVQAAEKATKINPQWAEGWQSLARAQANMGEFELAVANFEKAASLSETVSVEINVEELPWAREQLKRKVEKDALALDVAAEWHKNREPCVSMIDHVKGACSKQTNKRKTMEP